MVKSHTYKRCTSFLTTFDCFCLVIDSYILNPSKHDWLFVRQNFTNHISMFGELFSPLSWGHKRTCFMSIHLSKQYQQVRRFEPTWHKWLTDCKLTRIDAKMGVLIIHQNTSVVSIMSQHLGKRETVLKIWKTKARKDWTVSGCFSHPTSL